MLHSRLGALLPENVEGIKGSRVGRPQQKVCELRLAAGIENYDFAIFLWRCVLGTSKTYAMRHLQVYTQAHGTV